MASAQLCYRTFQDIHPRHFAYHETRGLKTFLVKVYFKMSKINIKEHRLRLLRSRPDLVRGSCNGCATCSASCKTRTYDTSVNGILGFEPKSFRMEMYYLYDIPTADCSTD